MCSIGLLGDREDAEKAMGKVKVPEDMTKNALRGKLKRIKCVQLL